MLIDRLVIRKDVNGHADLDRPELTERSRF
jgi:hypothetical protein